MTRTLATLLALALTLTTSGCATRGKRSHSSISVTSEPSGAEVWVSGRHIGDTPCELSLAWRPDAAVELRKSGYRTTTYLLDRSVSAGWVVLDFLAAPFVAVATTGLVGALTASPHHVGSNSKTVIELIGTLLGIPAGLGMIVNPIVDGATGNWNSPDDLDVTLQPDSLAGARP